MSPKYDKWGAGWDIVFGMSYLEEEKMLEVSKRAVESAIEKGESSGMKALE